MPPTPSITPACDDEIARVYLQGRDVACPRCGYNRRDGNGTACPECATLFRVSEGGRPILAAWWARLLVALPAFTLALTTLIGGVWHAAVMLALVEGVSVGAMSWWDSARIAITQLMGLVLLISATLFVARLWRTRAAARWIVIVGTAAFIIIAANMMFWQLYNIVVVSRG
ncbi:MAG: hypothetical protein DHS20C14_18350 [Phycisphaeraceae bacterium]|nr:MAG: hypothetical protein DHS20C14_18350 [Phycisphaeraceae bacterium]